MKLYRLSLLVLFLSLPLTYAKEVNFKVENHDRSNYYFVSVITDANSYHDDYYATYFFIHPRDTEEVKIPIDNIEGFYNISIENAETGDYVYEKKLSASHSSKLTCDIYTTAANCITR